MHELILQIPGRAGVSDEEIEGVTYLSHRVRHQKYEINEKRPASLHR